MWFGFGFSSSGSFGDLNYRITLQWLVAKIGEFPILPFDYYCPSLKDNLKERVCIKCYRYFPSKKAAALHKKNFHKKIMSSEKAILETIESVITAYASDSGSDVEQNTVEANSGDLQIIENMQEWLQIPFVEITAEM